LPVLIDLGEPVGLHHQFLGVAIHNTPLLAKTTGGSDYRGGAFFFLDESAFATS
jgi:hypothetical protein